MDSKATSTSAPTAGAMAFRRRAAFTLTEYMVSIAVGGMVMLGVVNIMMFSARSFSALSNYIELDMESQTALSMFSSDVRMSDGLISYNTNEIVLDYTNGTTLNFTWDPTDEEFRRTHLGNTTVLLTGCDFLSFEIFQRNPIPGAYDQIPTTQNPDECKLVQVTWSSSRDLVTEDANSEMVQSAKVVIRRK